MLVDAQQFGDLLEIQVMFGHAYSFVMASATAQTPKTPAAEASPEIPSMRLIAPSMSASVIWMLLFLMVCSWIIGYKKQGGSGSLPEPPFVATS